MIYLENQNAPLTSVEVALEEGFPGKTHLQRLLTRLSDAIITDTQAPARWRAIIVEAAKRETGVAIRDFLPKDVLDVEFATRRRLIDVDQLLRPYYGHVTPAVEELVQMGLEREVGDFWLEYFLKDNAVYRVNITACLCVGGALLKMGADTRLGAART